MLRKLHLNFVITFLTLMFFMGVLCNYSKAAESLPDNLVSVMEGDIASINSSVHDYFINNLSLVDDYTNVVRFIDYNNRGFAYYFFKSNVVGIANDYGVTRGLLNTQKFMYTYYPVLMEGGQVSASSLDCYMFICWNNQYSITHAVRSGSVYNVTQYVNMPLYNVDYGICNGVSQTVSQYSSENIYLVDTNAGSITYSYISGYTGGYNYYQGDFKSTNVLSNCDFCFCDKNNYTLAVYTYDNWDEIYPPAVEDDRISIYTLQTNNGKQLNLDLSAFRSGYSAAVIKTFSDVVITLDCDGSEVEYTLDSNNSNIIDIWSASNNVHTIQTLYNYFDLDSYDDVFISKVSFSLTTSSAGGSGTEDFNIACQYYLKDTNTAPITPEVIEDPDYNDTNIYNTTQINNIKQDLHEFSSRFSFLSGTWNFVLEEDLPSFPGWATVFTNYVWFADGNSDTTYRGHWFQMANNIPSIADLTRPFDPSEFLEQNKTFAFYDVILLKVWTVEVLSGSVIDNYDLAGYLVFISDRYYDHYNSRLNLDILTQLQLSAENTVMFYDVCKARLDAIALDLGIGFNGLLDTSTGTQYKIISWLQTVNDNMFGSFVNLSNTLSDGFSSVVTAINNITPGGSSYSLPALSDTLSYLFTPSLEWSAINYDDYEESLGVLALPFQFTFDILDIAQNQYDPHFKLHLNELSLDVPLEAGSDPETTNFTVIEDQDIEQDPLDVIPSNLWTTLQYLNAFGLVMVQALSTYNHIFRR